MDFLTQTDGQVNDRTPLRVASKTRALKKRDYAIGIVLLLCVVVLWTASNFITQVCLSFPTYLCSSDQCLRTYSRMDSRNPSCEP